MLFTWVYDNTKGSLFLMVLLHAVINIATPTIQGSNWIGPTLYLILLWVVVMMVVVMAGAARLSRSSSVAPA